MASIYNLATSPDQLASGNRGVTKELYEQQTPTRAVDGTNFPNGQISFRWNTSGTKWMMLSKSYLRMRVKLTRPNGSDALLTQDDLAPTMSQCASLFQSLEFRINDKTVSRVSDYVGAVDALYNRVNKSASQLDSVGASTNWWQDSFVIRRDNVSADGVSPATPTTVFARLTLGYAVGDQITIVDGPGFGSTISFTNAADADLTNTRSIFSVGDSIRIGNLTSLIDEVTASTIHVTSPFTAAGHAATAFSRVRHDADTRNVSEYELIWRPPLSIFACETAIPCGKFELILTPQTSSVYKIAAVESSTLARSPTTDGANNQYQFNVENLLLYVNTIEGERCDSLTYFLDLDQYAVQAESLAGANSFGQKGFDVSPSTKALCVCFADGRNGTDTRCSNTKFRAYRPGAGGIINTKDDVGLTLNRLFVSYAGRQLPQPDADPAFSPSVDRTAQRYIETLMNTGAYHDTANSETIQQFHNRGSYYYFNFPKDSNDRSTRVTVHTGFNAESADMANTRLLLFSISSQVAKITIENGSVTDVDVQDQ